MKHRHSPHSQRAAIQDIHELIPLPYSRMIFRIMQVYSPMRLQLRSRTSLPPSSLIRLAPSTPRSAYDILTVFLCHIQRADHPTTNLITNLISFINPLKCMSYSATPTSSRDTVPCPDELITIPLLTRLQLCLRLILGPMQSIATGEITTVLETLHTNAESGIDWERSKEAFTAKW